MAGLSAGFAGAGLLAGGAGIAGSFLGGGGPNQQEIFTPGLGLTNRASSGEINTILNRVSGGASQRFAQAIPGLATEIRNIRQDLAAPGLGARSLAVENRRSAAIGNLRENLARRRVLGSSFGEDALARAEAEFSLSAGEAALQEVSDSIALINEEARLLGLGLQQELAELGIATGAGADFADFAQRASLAEASLRQSSITGAAEGLGLLAGFGFGGGFGGGGGGQQAPVSINRAAGFPLVL